MMRTRGKATMLALGCVAALALPASAENWDCHWSHPCDDGSLTCCYQCEAQWNASGNWTGATCTGYPDVWSESAIIKHSNTRYCDGGDNDGEPCDDDSDCTDGTCGHLEEYLELTIYGNYGFGGLKIETKSTLAASDTLDVHFKSTGTCEGERTPCDEHSDCQQWCNFTERTLSTVDSQGELAPGLGIVAGAGPVTVSVESNVHLSLGYLVLDAESGPATITVSGGEVNTDSTDEPE